MALGDEGGPAGSEPREPSALTEATAGDGSAVPSRMAPVAAAERIELIDVLRGGVYGKVGPALLIVPTIVVYAGQVWFSNWWLRRFLYGPMEWLWRSLTYGRIGPLRRAPEAGFTLGG